MEQPTKENIIKAYNIAKETGADSTCKVLEALYPDMDFMPKESRPVTERIKTFEDALNELGGSHPAVLVYQDFEDYVRADKSTADVLAYLKLRIVVAALNEGWEPQHTEDEVRWHPWHWLYTQDEIDDMGDEQRTENCMIPTGEYVTEYAGLAYAISSDAPSSATADVGSRLCLKSRELATYCGRQFIDLWVEYKLICR